MRARRITWAVVLAAIVAQATIVDRVAVRVGNKIVTASEIELRIRLAAFQSREKVEFSPASRKLATQQLIEQRLVEREMDIGHYPGQTPEQRTGLLPEYATQWFGGDAGAMGRGLTSYGLRPADLEEDLARQANLLAFLALRFRQATDPLVADADLEAWLKEQRASTRVEYLEKELAP